jgi:hypothetical protein
LKEVANRAASLSESAAITLTCKRHKALLTAPKVENYFYILIALRSCAEQNERKKGNPLAAAK